MPDIYIWDDSGGDIEGTITPADTRTGNLASATTDADAASTVLDGLPAGNKALIFTAGTVINNLYTLADGLAATLVALITNQPDDADAVSYFNTYFARINSNGSDIDYIFAAYETDDLKVPSLSAPAASGTVFEANIQAVIDDSGAAANLPEWLKAIIVNTDFAPNDGSNVSQKAWNQWAMWSKAATYRRLIKDAAEAALGHPVTVLNFNDTVVSDTYRAEDTNGLDFGTQSVDGLICSRNGYMRGTDSEGYFSGLSLTLENRWNHFIRHLNEARSCIAAGGEVIPWVGMPNYNGGVTSDPNSFIEPTYLWEEIIKHYHMLGVNKYIWFNEVAAHASPATMVPFALKTWDNLSQLSVPGTLALTGIPYDSTSVTTGSVTTVYDASLVT